MKKSTILVICLVFVASVLVVGFFGMQVASYYSKIYITGIKPSAIYCSTDEKLSFINSDQPNRYPIRIRAFEEDMVVRIDYDVSPGNATARDNIQISITGQGSYSGNDDNPVATLDGRSIILHQLGYVEITYRAMDGSNVYMTVVLYVMS